MAPKLTARQQVQLAWLDALPPKFDRIKRTIEMLASNHVDDTQVRNLVRLLDELKSQAAQINIGPLADQFGYMAMIMRRAGGQQTKVRGLQDLLAGARVNFDGAHRAASTPIAESVVEDTDVSP